MELPKYGLLELGFLASLLFFTAMDPLWRHTIGAAFKRLATISLDASFAHIHWAPFGWLGKVNEAVETRIENGKAWSERGVVYALNQLIDAAALYVGVPLALGLALVELAKWAVSHAGKTITRVEVHKVVQPVKTVVKEGARVTKVVTHQVVTKTQVVANTAVAVPGLTIETWRDTRTAARRADHYINAHKRQLERVFGLLGIAGASALVVRALGREMASLLKCGKVKQVAKTVCNFDTRWLNALIGGFALIYVSEGIIPFAKSVQALTDDMASSVLTFWKSSAIGKGGDRKLGDATLTLPSN